jgi:hypothetical protein
MDEPFNLSAFIPLAAADLIPQLLAEIKERALSLHNELSQPGVMGRPPKQIDPYLFVYLILQGHQIKILASYFNTTPQTLHNKFGDIIATCQLIRHDEILRKQNEKVREGDSRMLIHLGKTVLGQNETLNINNDITSGPRQFKVERPVKPAIEAPPPQGDSDASPE